MHDIYSIALIAIGIDFNNSTELTVRCVIASFNYSNRKTTFVTIVTWYAIAFDKIGCLRLAA